jgi:hypothetical protein
MARRNPTPAPSPANSILFNLAEFRRAAGRPSRLPARCLDARIGVLTARHQQGSAKTSSSPHSGHTESHNHNDVGNFRVCHNGAPF